MDNALNNHPLPDSSITMVLSGLESNAGKTSTAKLGVGYLTDKGLEARHIMVDRPEAPFDGEHVRLGADPESVNALLGMVYSVTGQQSIVIDVGAHVFSQFIASVKDSGDILYADLYTRGQLVVVIAPTQKVEETIRTLDWLSVDLGFSPRRIALLVNQVKVSDWPTVRAQMQELFAVAKKLEIRVVTTPLYTWPLIKRLRGERRTAFEILRKDEKALRKTIEHWVGSGKPIQKCPAFLEMQEFGLAKAMQPNMAEVFNEIFGA